MKNNISIVFPEIKSDSGTKTYVQNTLRSLDKVNLLYKYVPVKKIELSLLGKPYFGVLFQYLFIMPWLTLIFTFSKIIIEANKSKQYRPEYCET